MGRPENKLESVELRISTNPRLREQLERLVVTGLYGKNITEAAERLIAQGLERWLRGQRATGSNT